MTALLQPMTRFDDVITRFNEVHELDDRRPGKHLLASGEKKVGGEVDERGLVTDQRLVSKIEQRRRHHTARRVGVIIRRTAVGGASPEEQFVAIDAKPAIENRLSRHKDVVQALGRGLWCLGP